MTPEKFRRAAKDRLAGLEPGEPLRELDAAFIRFALAISPTRLDRAAADRHARDALALGATPRQLHDVVVLLSALGTHALMLGSVLIDQLDPAPDHPLDNELQELWDRYVGKDPYWDRFEAFVPGFLGALLRQSPRTFEAFFSYCALPWQDRSLPAKLMELIALAVDATPAHRFGPGFRLHLENAISLGISPARILGALEIAIAADDHAGVL